MKIWKIILSVMVIFGAGVVTGGLLVGSALRSQPASQETVASRAPSANPLPGRQQFVQRVRSQLDLTVDQSAEVDRIMRQSHERMMKILDPVSPQTREETRRVRQEIQAILTPRQRKKFNEEFKRRPREGEELRERMDARPQPERR